MGLSRRLPGRYSTLVIRERVSEIMGDAPQEAQDAVVTLVESDLLHLPTLLRYPFVAADSLLASLCWVSPALRSKLECWPGAAQVRGFVQSLATVEALASTEQLGITQ